MTDCRRRTLALLWSLHDLLPGPKGARFGHGLAPAAKRPCPDCGDSDTPGWLLDRFKRQRPCLTCGGSLEPARKGRGWVRVDPMDSQRQVLRTDAADVQTRAAATKLCDGCGGTGVGYPHLDEQGHEYRDPCGHCGGSGRRVAVLFDLAVERERGDVGTALEQAIERRRAAGDYVVLERALADLRRLHPRCWRVLVGTCVLRQTPPAAGTFRASLLDLSLRFVEARMPDRPKVPGDVWAAWRRTETAPPSRAVGRAAGTKQLALRDKEIRKLDRDGKPRQWIAAEYGLSVASVKAIVNGRAAA